MAENDIKSVRENDSATYDEIVLNELWHKSHGIVACGAKTFNNSTHVLELASVNYYYKAINFTTASPVNCDIDSFETLTTNTLYFFYFNDETGAIQCSATSWSFKENVFIATVFWNGSAGAVQNEIHNHTRNLDWHEWAHDTIGMRYESGSGLTYPNDANDDTLQIETGSYHDEDIEIVTGQCTSMRGWYEASSGVYTFADFAFPYLGATGQPQYLDTDTYILTNVGATAYACYWVYASNDEDEPIYIVPTQAATTHGNMVSARAELPPNLLGMNFNSEIKLIYQFIYKGDGEFQESDDYRLSSPVPGGGLGTMTASDVVFVPAGTIESTNVQSAIEELDTEKAATDDIPVKATGAELVTGTDDAKFATAKALDDAEVAYIHVGATAPSDTTILWLDTN